MTLRMERARWCSIWQKSSWSTLVRRHSWWYRHSFYEVGASTSMVAIRMMIVVMPFFFLTIYEKNGQHLEVILWKLIETTFVKPKGRFYRTDNKYATLKRFAEADQEIMEIVMYSEAMRLKRKQSVKSSREQKITTAFLEQYSSRSLLT